MKFTKTYRKKIYFQRFKVNENWDTSRNIDDVFRFFFILFYKESLQVCNAVTCISHVLINIYDSMKHILSDYKQIGFINLHYRQINF